MAAQEKGTEEEFEESERRAFGVPEDALFTCFRDLRSYLVESRVAEGRDSTTVIHQKNQYTYPYDQ